jgi:predicted outer membrane repeat protein
MGTKGKRKIMVVACALMVGVSAVAQAKVIYVDDDAEAPGDGSSWATAFTWLGHALAVAEAGDEIRVAEGFYRPDQGLPAATRPRRSVRTTNEAGALGSPAATFLLKNGVTLMGGFAGIPTPDPNPSPPYVTRPGGGAGITDPNARNVEWYSTILTGDLRGNDVDLWGPGSPLYESLRADNSLRVVTSVNVDATAVLDGFIIEAAVDCGLYNQGGSPQITNCVFRKVAGQNLGGNGLRCEGGQPTLLGCVFQDNSAIHHQGGAIFVSEAELALVDCHFVGNWALMEGGAICSVDSDLTLTGCAFEKNSAREGGAIHQTAGTLTLVECTFEGNAAESGGAVAFSAETASMTRCLFAGNWATRWGGAIEIAETPLTLDGCTFSGNAASEGGAVYAGRLTSPRAVAGPGTALTHCLFTGNRGYSRGGALYSDYVEFAILGCTFADNQAAMAATLGWPLLGADHAPYQHGMDNCIVWDGKESIAPSPPPTRRSPETPEEEGPEAIVAITYSDVQGGWPGEGNIDADPCFAAPGLWLDATSAGTIVPPGYANAVWVSGDYHVKSQAGHWNAGWKRWVVDEVTSPCIDTGDPNSPFDDEPEPNGGRINMGAYGGTAEASKSYVQELSANSLIGGKYHE